MKALVLLLLLADGGAGEGASPQALLTQACASCHSLKLVEQQRLTEAQWRATITKMRGWGALVDDAQAEQLAQQLAALRGPAAPLPALERVDGRAMRTASEPLRPTLPRGDAARGGALFTARCVACHGPDARGLIGVNLVLRPILDREPELAAFVRKGRGLMVPNPDLTDAQLGDLVAYLKTLPGGGAR